MVTRTINVEVDVDIEPSDLSPYDIIVKSLCNELDRHGVESFLKAFVYEVSKIDMDNYHLINQRITDYLNNKNS